MANGLDELHGKYGIQRLTSDLASSTASTAIASNPGANLMLVLHRVKASASAAATLTLAWGTAAGTVAWRRYMMGGTTNPIDEEVLIFPSSANQPLILVTTAGIGNNFFEVYASVRPAGGVRSV